MAKCLDMIYNPIGCMFSKQYINRHDILNYSYRVTCGCFCSTGHTYIENQYYDLDFFLCKPVDRHFHSLICSLF